MNLAQKWLAGLIGLGALFLVVSNPKGVAAGLTAAQEFVSGTERTAITGK
ncbi:MAG TPA: hypothetical protein VGG25_10295 [Streptosporangiaceae bacterium]